MKKLLFGIIVGVLAGGVGVWVFLHGHGGAHAEAKPEEKKEEPRVQKDGNDETFLKLEKEDQERAGLKIAALTEADLKPELRAFGRVVDPSSLATGLTDLAAARAQLTASAKDFERLKILNTQGQNVSTRALEAAEALVQRDQIVAQAAQLRLTTTWGKDIAGRADLNAFVHALVAQESSLVRVDVPVTEKLESLPASARLAALAAPDQTMDATFVAAALAADAQTQARGFLFLLPTNALPANSPVLAWLTLGGAVEKGVIIPRDALVRHEGKAFVYVQTTDETFERKEVELHHPLAAGWFTGEFKPGVKVVIVGAQQLLSEELKGEGGGE